MCWFGKCFIQRHQKRFALLTFYFVKCQQSKELIATESQIALHFVKQNVRSPIGLAFCGTKY